MACRASYLLLSLKFIFFLSKCGDCDLNERSQVFVSVSHFAYEQTDLNVAPYSVISANASAECALECAAAPQCQAFTTYLNTTCRLYNKDQCTNNKVQLMDKQGAKLFEKKEVNNGGRSVEEPKCLLECLKRNNGDCGKCGRPNHAGKFCETVCPPSWKAHSTSSKCYKASKKAVTSYWWSEEACKDEGGNLAIDNSEFIHNFLKAEYSTKKYVIGLTDRQKEGDWRHADGTTTTRFNAWAAKEPLGSYTDCVAYTPITYTLSVSFSECTAKGLIFCQYQAGNKECRTPTYGCISLYTVPQDGFDAAATQCKSKNGVMVTVNNEDDWTKYKEDSIFNDFLDSAQDEIIFLGHKKVAGTAKNSINQIKNCPKGVMENPSTYLQSTPDIWYDIHHETKSLGDCVVFKRRPNFFWKDISCALQEKYICEYELKSQLDACPSSYVKRDNQRQCLKISKEQVTYDEAEKACVRDGSRLLLVKDKDTHEFIQWLMFKDGRANFYFIGLNDRAEEGTFLWSDGSRWSINTGVYNRFTVGYPQGYYTNCAMLNAVGNWVSVDCDNLESGTYALCETKPEDRLI